MDEFLAIIKYFGGNFAPRGFAFCQGQTLAIQTNTALFSLLGVTYGGNGTTTFALPDLRGRAPIQQGQGPGLSNYSLGQQSGAEQVTLTQAQMPQHTHVATGSLSANNVKGTTNVPTAGYQLARGFDGDGDPNALPFIYAPAPTSQAPGNPVALGGVSVTNSIAGGSQPFNIVQPILGLNALICTQGVYPSRN